MTSVPATDVQGSRLQGLLNRVPEITIFFWVIKILGTTVGETAADFLNVNLNLGLTITSVVTGFLLAVALFFQFKAKRYVPGIYWCAVVLISVFGTLVTDNLTDAIGVPLEASTLFFSLALAGTFALWYAKEKTLSIHSIVTAKREMFYWLAILFTFALGTAAGDLMAEGLGLGYFTTGVIVAVAIAIFAIAWRMGLNAILSFWVIYILTRPLGASLGDFLSQPHKYGGLGLGATTTTVLFVGAIIAAVAYLAATKKDVTKQAVIQKEEQSHGQRDGLMQTAVVILVLAILSGVGYSARQSFLNEETGSEESVTEVDSTQPDTTATAPTATDSGTPKPSSPSAPSGSTPTPTTPKPQPTSTLGDLSSFRTITQDTLAFVNQNNLSGAKDRIGDLEFEWDQAEGKLKAKDKAKWTEVDDAIDEALRQLRSVHPTVDGSRSSLQALLATLN